MSSSISPSKSGRAAVTFGWVFLIALPLALAYGYFLNPEIEFWRQAIENKQSWAAKMRLQEDRTQPLTVFSGGSTCAFQVDSGLLFREFQARTLNYGLHAGMGADATIAAATSILKPGDRLILNTEAAMLGSGGGIIPTLGCQVLALTGAAESGFLQSSLSDLSGTELIWSCRPGMYHTSTMLGKILLRKPGYRYNTSGLRDGGLVTTPIREDYASSRFAAEAHQLTGAGRNLLRELKAWTAERNIQLIYLMPVNFVSPGDLAEQRRLNSLFLAEVEQVIPVWRDEFLGASDQPGDFSDTAAHMTAKAAETRTRHLGMLHFSSGTR